MLLAGIPLLLYLSLGLVYLEQKRGQDDAFAQVQTSLESLRRPAPDLKGLEADTAQAEGGINEAMGLYVQADSDAMVAWLLQKAESSGLQAVGIAAKAIATRKEGDRSYSVQPLSLQAVGTKPQLIGFLNSLDYPSLQVENISLSLGKDGYSITMEIVIHLTPKE